MARFAARARTIDLLGRQQIASIPTAISELFKNAHDAYAERVEVDFFRYRDLLVLGDDGLGMTPADFEDRWLTLGTESKLDAGRGLEPPPHVKGHERPVLGEKGIGRLAIASIGPQVVVLTRASRGKSLSPLTVALVNWRLFELPGINLDEVEVPIRQFPRGGLPGQDDLRDMADEIRAQLKRLKLRKAECEPILADLDCLDFDPKTILNFIDQPGLGGRGHGTLFLITPTREQLSADLAPAEGKDRTSAPLVQTLIGFANTMTPGAAEPVIKTAFRDHRAEDDTIDVLADSEFFTPEEFAAADHHIEGVFDKTGFFRGTVNVYGRGTERYTLGYGASGDEALACGSFRLNLAYLQGKARESRVDPALHAALLRKLDVIGGLYIYRDGIRVLPYGQPEADFLQLEKRRSQNIGRYFFSYRRMLGVVELSSELNAQLEEKAGREGFRENKAYRQFRDVLQRFFAQVAVDYFRVGGEHAEAFEVGREEARRRHDLRQAREKEARKTREKFAAEVGELLAAIDEERPATDARALIADLEKRLKRVGAKASAKRILEAETGAFAELDALRERYSVREPRGFGLTPDLRRDYDALVASLAELEGKVWTPTAKQIARLVSRATDRADQGPTRRQRLLFELERLRSEAVSETEASAKEARAAADKARREVAVLASLSVETVQATAAEITDEAGRDGKALASDIAFVRTRTELEQRLDEVARRQEELLGVVAERLRRAAVVNGNGAGPAAPADLTSLLEEEVLELREQAERDFELAQVGMATEVITHELDATVTAIRGSLRQLHAWAEVNPSLQDLFEDLRTSFEHLDGYLSLFTPLQRRLRRRREPLRGAKLEEFLHRLFERRLEELDIELRSTKAFRDWTATGFRSMLYPVFVNLVDNSTYWVRQTPPPYWIRLQARGKNLLLTDSGPGIPERDREAAFEYGFTRKPGGRGAGLHISREVLRREGWEISIVDPPKGAGAAFRIEPPSNE